MLGNGCYQIESDGMFWIQDEAYLDLKGVPHTGDILLTFRARCGKLTDYQKETLEVTILYKDTIASSERFTHDNEELIFAARITYDSLSETQVKISTSSNFIPAKVSGSTDERSLAVKVGDITIATDLDEIDELCRLAEKYYDVPLGIKKYIQQRTHFSKGNYYSPIPTVDEIQASWEFKGSRPAYFEDSLYNDRDMYAFLKEKLLPYAPEFDPPTEHPGINGVYYWNNGFFSGSDAMSYYCMLRYFKPEKILEIGAGFSTMVALCAIKKNKKGEIFCIEPYPSEQLRSISADIQLIEKPVFDISLKFFDQFSENDVIFIDSTHTVKAGGDGPFIYLKIVPRLKNGVVVHAHDISLPMARSMHQLHNHEYWAEIYILQAYLLENPNISILYGSNYSHHFHEAAMHEFMAEKSVTFGGSFWFVKSASRVR